MSIVISTYNSEERLPKILPLFSQQNYPSDKFEVVVVNDGSTDGTQRFLDNYHAPFRLKSFAYRENKGRAAACNLGIRHSTGEIVIIIDDDMFFSSDFILNHVKLHLQDERLGVLGMVKRYPHTRSSRFIERLLRREAESIQKIIAHKDNLDSLGISTANFSIKKDIIIKVGLFDESFTGYGSEDWELGYRLGQSGVRFIYAPDALSWHDFYVDNFIKLCRRKMIEGYSVGNFFRIHPELEKTLEVDSVFVFKGSGFSMAKKVIKSVLINSATLPFWHIFIFFNEMVVGVGLDFFYDQIGAYYYRKGLRNSFRERKCKK